MKHFFRGVIAVLILGVAVPAQAAFRILATTADWGALATELGGDRVNVYTATSALQDVHRVDAKPSLVARARTADLLISNGGELEIGWLPVLVRESGNNRIQPGGPGYFEATAQVTLLEKPSRLDRSIDGGYPPLGKSARAAGSAQHRDYCESAHCAARVARCRQCSVLPAARRRFRCAMGTGDCALGQQGSTAQGSSGRRHASRPGVSVSLARIEGARCD